MKIRISYYENKKEMEYLKVKYMESDIYENDENSFKRFVSK